MSSSPTTELHGILLVDKPEGATSAGVVRVVKRRLGVRKVGHLGTLDPFATGLLPLCVGEGSKVVPFLNQAGKAYEGRVRLGVATDTLDPTGVVVDRQPVPPLDAAGVREAADRFVGEIEQVPPMHSALKQGGVRLYELARKGEVVDRPPRRVVIESLDVALTSPDTIELRVRCSKGTYIRTLAADLAAVLGTVGHLAQLRRTEFGTFRIEDARPPDDLDPDGDVPMLSPRDALVGVPDLEIDAAFEAEVRLGKQHRLAALSGPRNAEDLLKLVGESGALVAIVGAKHGRWSLERVFAPAIAGR